MKYICDTNFIIRYLIADNEELFAKTQSIFSKVQTGQIVLVLEQTVFTEAIFVLTSFYKVPRSEVASTLLNLLAYKGISSDRETLSLSLRYYSSTNLHIVDCLLLARKKLTDLPILSFDHELNTIAKTTT